jgi:hypothetical protein
VSPQSAAPPGPFGVADATARGLLNGAARQPHLSTTHAFVSGVRRAYQALPASARGAAVTSAFAWAKTYVTSPAFATAYAAARQQAQPAGLPTYDMSVDEEAKKELDQKLAELEQTRKAIGVLPEADRAAVLAASKEAEDLLRSPQMIKSIRDEIESRRAADTNGTTGAATDWNALYPADVRVFVRQELERFLAASAKIDFTIPVTIIKNPSGAIVGFVAPLDRVLDSWMEAECMMAGRDMVTAARASVEAWIKELPK